MKKTVLFIILLISATFCLAQSEINSENYYTYYSTGRDLKGSRLKTSWLNEVEVSQIIRKEMEQNGFEWLSNFKIIKLDSSTHVISICYSAKSNFGFLFEPMHGMHPDVNSRKIKSMYKSMTGNDYAEKIINIDGSSDFVKIKEMPNNLFIVKADCYWYQETDNPKDNKKLVTREIIIQILRQDIQTILNEIKKQKPY